MEKDVHFNSPRKDERIHLVSKGCGFFSDSEVKIPLDSAECAKIEDVRRQFKRKALEKKAEIGERKTRDERLFVNKVQFILQFKYKPCGDSILIDLLTDQTTLFSRDYQVYAADHGAYLDLRRRQGNKKDTQLQWILNEALSEAPCGEKERYRELLLRIVEKAKQEKKHPLEIEQMMIDQAVGRSVDGQVLEDSTRNAEKDVKADGILNVLRKTFPEWELTPQEAEYLLQSAF